MDLSARLFFVYLWQADRVEAEQQIKRIEASIVPHVKKSEMQQILRRYHERITRHLFIDRQKQIDDAWSTLRAMKNAKPGRRIVDGT